MRTRGNAHVRIHRQRRAGRSVDDLRGLRSGGGTLTTNLEAALEYATADYPVFPVRGKRPLTEHGFKDATTDSDTIRAWYATHPEAGIGIPTGDRTGVVLDVDPRHGGDESLRALEAEIGSLPHGPRAKTGGGGWHYWFAHPGGGVPSSHGFRPGLDLQADGAYVVVPPSGHPSGGRYEWEVPLDGAKLPLLPGWLLKLTIPGEGDRPAPRTDLGADGKIPHSQHHEAIVSMAASFASRVAGLSEDQAAEVLRGALAPLLDDLPTHETEIQEAARSGVGKFGRPVEKPSKKGPPAADLLVEIARGKADLFRDGEGELYATVTAEDGNAETHRLRSSGFRRWLGSEYYRKHSRAPPSDAMSTARATIEALAEFEGPVRNVALRVGFDDCSLYVDLGDDTRRVVRVAPSGWEIVASSPVRFIRGKGMGALPIPEHGGSLLDLLPFLNARNPTEPHYVLSVGWLLGIFHPSGPYPVLAITGEQGAGKSNATVRLKALCDPATPPHRAAPKEPRDLAVAGRGSWVLAFDNLSTIPDWLSDAICRLSTGGGFATRSLYTDDEEVVFSGKRPVVFNGIVPVADAADLRDRALLVTWPKMKSAKTERKLDPAFKNVASHVFGAILDAVVLALAGREAVEEEYAGRLPRMGDFFCWVVAAEAILPWPKGTFERVYAESRTA
ncbi:MAG: bifunctional DNA primase/polymerase, partial [Thermoplasmata archaeon]